MSHSRNPKEGGIAHNEVVQEGKKTRQEWDHLTPEVRLLIQSLRGWSRIL